MAKERFLGSAFDHRTAGEARDFYDRWSEVYDEELTESAYDLPRRCAAVLARYAEDRRERVVDIGCGTGLSGIALARAGFTRVDGCDFSSGMLEKAFRVGAYSKVFRADLNAPPIDARDGEYGALTAVGIFSYGDLETMAVDEFLRITKPGAPIVIGLNDRFFTRGTLTDKLERLVAARRIEPLSQEYGERIGGAGDGGWVIAVRRV